MPSKVTIDTVARHANVSRQTVSNVLNAPDMVRDETRARVMAAIEELGYRANLAARQMRTGRSRLIGVRIDPIRNGIEASVLDRFLHGITESAAPAGYRIVLYTAADDATEIATYDDLLASYALDAFVLTHTHHEDTRTAWLRQRRVPFTTFGRPWGAQDRHSWVDIDGAAGTDAATDHLIAAGHRRIAFLGWPLGLRRRRRPARRLGSGRCVRPGWLPTGSPAHAFDGVAEGERLTARSARARRIRRPQWSARATRLPWARGDYRNLAVIGFDDTPMAQATGLSSVRQPLAEAAAECVRTLSLLLGDHPTPLSNGDRDARDPDVADPSMRHVLLAPHLVVRDSG